MPATRNAEATKARILRSAIAEFATHGFAGARIDRIAESAGANVRMIYAYFGGKDALFDAALAAAIADMAAAVPPAPEDLAEWAGRLFDYHARDPRAMRISMWAQLERPLSASEPLDAYLAKTESVSPSTSAGLGAVDLLAIVYAVAQAWYLTPVGLLAVDGSDPASPDRIAMHREAVVRSVARIAAPTA